MTPKIVLTKIKYSTVELSKLIRMALASFQQEGGAQGAAGMAYYTLFSFFPLLIVLVTIGTFFVDGTEAISKIAQLVISVFPVSEKLVEVNLARIMVLRNPIGLLGLFVFLWSGSKAFSMMVHHITCA